MCSVSTPEELRNKQVSQVTCGSQHTVVLTKGSVKYVVSKNRLVNLNENESFSQV